MAKDDFSEVIANARATHMDTIGERYSKSDAIASLGNFLAANNEAQVTLAQTSAVSGNYPSAGIFLKAKTDASQDIQQIVTANNTATAPQLVSADTAITRDQVTGPKRGGSLYTLDS